MPRKCTTEPHARIPAGRESGRGGACRQEQIADCPSSVVFANSSQTQLYNNTIGNRRREHILQSSQATMPAGHFCTIDSPFHARRMYALLRGVSCFVSSKLQRCEFHPDGSSWLASPISSELGVFGVTPIAHLVMSVDQWIHFLLDLHVFIVKIEVCLHSRTCPVCTISSLCSISIQSLLLAL